MSSGKSASLSEVGIVKPSSAAMSEFRGAIGVAIKVSSRRLNNFRLMGIDLSCQCDRESYRRSIAYVQG